MHNPYAINLPKEENLPRAKRIFCAAMAKAMSEGKDYRKINVSDLCRMSDLSRTTFYANYNSVEEVLKDLESCSLTSFSEHFNKVLLEKFSSPDLREAVSFYIECSANKHAEIFTNLVKLQDRQFYEAWTILLKRSFYPLFDDRLDYDMICELFANLVQNAVRYFILNPGKYAIDQFVNSIAFVYNAIKTSAKDRYSDVA